MYTWDTTSFRVHVHLGHHAVQDHSQRQMLVQPVALQVVCDVFEFLYFWIQQGAPGAGVNQAIARHDVQRLRLRERSFQKGSNVHQYSWLLGLVPGANIFFRLIDKPRDDKLLTTFSAAVKVVVGSPPMQSCTAYVILLFILCYCAQCFHSLI